MRETRGLMLVGLFTGVVLPLVMLVLKRHYDAQKNKWEEVYVTAGIALLMLGGGVWVVKRLEEDFGFVEALVSVIAALSAFVGFCILIEALRKGHELMRETRDKDV